MGFPTFGFLTENSDMIGTTKTGLKKKTSDEEKYKRDDGKESTSMYLKSGVEAGSYKHALSGRPASLTKAAGKLC